MAQKKILFVGGTDTGWAAAAASVMKRDAGDEFDISFTGVQARESMPKPLQQLLSSRGLGAEGVTSAVLKELDGKIFDMVVTIGQAANEIPPVFAGNPKRVHWTMEGPGPDAASSDVLARRFKKIEREVEEICKELREFSTSRELHLVPGIQTCFFRPLAFNPARHLSAAAEAGIKSIEFGVYYGTRDYQYDRFENVRELKSVASDLGIGIFSLHAGGQMTAHLDRRERQAAIDIAKVYADLGAMLGANVIVIHGGMDPNAPREQGIELLMESFAELQEHIMYMPCRFGWENNVTGLSAAEHIELLKTLSPSAFCLTLDNGHSHIHKNTDEYIRLAGRWLSSLHLHDNDGVSDLHILPGAGTFNWKGFLNKLTDAGFTGPLTVEMSAPSDLSEENLLDNLKKVVVSVEMIKQESA